MCLLRRGKKKMSIFKSHLILGNCSKPNRKKILPVNRVEARRWQSDKNFFLKIIVTIFERLIYVRHPAKC